MPQKFKAVLMKFFFYLFAYSPITIFVHIFENFLYSKVSVNLYINI